MVSIKNALLLRERYPDCEVTVFYIDVRAAGEMYEEYYLRAQDAGVDFVRGRGGEVFERDGCVYLRYEDTLSGEKCEEPFDIIVLSVGMQPHPRGDEIAKMLNLSRRADRFIQIGHPKMRPVDTHIRGVFVAGAASGPKEIQVAVEQGSAAAAKVLNLLRSGEVAKEAGGVRVDADLCIGCRLCENVCPYGIVSVEGGKAQVREVMCRGCGACSAACPTGAIQPRLFSDEQIYAQIREVLREKSEYPLIIGFLCHWCSYAAADLAGLSRVQYPTSLRPIRVLCSGRVNPSFVLAALREGADGVLVGGCRLGECHYVHGNYDAQQRLTSLKEILKDIGFNPQRLQMAWLAASEGEKFAQIVEAFTEELKALGPVGSEFKPAKARRTHG
jgi:heterodisulfide reductase subunit A